jgi:hypothetical protein
MRAMSVVGPRELGYKVGWAYSVRGGIGRGCDCRASGGG